MPFTRKKRVLSSDHDSGDDEVSHVKRAKPIGQSKPATTASNSSAKIDANGDNYWEISKMRRVNVSSFRGKNMVNIREYYEKDGQELPGKKGISLPVDQFACLLKILPEIETALGELGEPVPRPEYDAIKSNPGEGDEQQGESEGNTNNPPDSKKNIEMTSEEDESEE
ncbi:transcriptional coactivator p15/PC4 family protein [Aspergillus candidus]|uniref:Putative RNA polymerase II transcriptional coactivator n=1 Tax=Aspergillus candidus TaxID=41067 RepID=A0A2I2FP41_ASPCN|nr:putative RNA polymerase II transcriptional coactivator [Aspergillus candidus]PLB42396.1 putative RNA polymerase II transcriptional coactivator [Aspergillus candidus]